MSDDYLCLRRRLNSSSGPNMVQALCPLYALAASSICTSREVPFDQDRFKRELLKRLQMSTSTILGDLSDYSNNWRKRAASTLSTIIFSPSEASVEVLVNVRTPRPTHHFAFNLRLL